MRHAMQQTAGLGASSPSHSPIPAPTACSSGSTTERNSARLRARHLRPTQTRLAVLAELTQAVPRCLDAAQLTRTLLPRLKRLTPATIYRALNDLWEAGLLLRSRNPQGHACYGIQPDDTGAPADTLACQCGNQVVMLVIEDHTLHEHLRTLAGAAGCALRQDAPLVISLACAED